MMSHEELLATERRAALEYARGRLRSAIADLEHALGPQGAYPVTSHMLAAMEAAREMGDRA